MTLVLMIIGMIIVTWGIRVTPVLLPRLNLSPAVLTVLNCVPAAVLSALIAEPLLDPVANTGQLLQPGILAASLCLVLGLIGSPMLLTVILGMVSFWLLGIWI
ncbi:AzlD domain-containing protein [Reinekea sp.]|jgi:branched-subunit amino acid transport protein|uniref:AzlD domain-containing protein n=1 Tax=Reinekea sp. TaxID=1970455 RepID=UPI00398A41F3